MRAVLMIAGVSMALTAFAGCGDDDAPTDASVEDFCANFSSFDETLSSFGEDPDAATVVKAIKGVADDMVETGTPEDMPDDARAGFDLTMGVIQDLDDDASEEDILAIGKDFSDADQAKSAAFDDYLASTCDYK